jgi:calcineurin-like phosphoesterase family protein
MDEALITNWNSVVTPEDTVWHLGDFGFGHREYLQRIVNRLNGRKNRLWGNHDKPMRQVTGFQEVEYYKELYDGNKKIILCHYGMRVWNKSHYGSIQLYGHSHGSLPGNDQSLDVGVDCWNYFPVTLEQIIEKMKTLPAYRQGDGHKSNRKDKMLDEVEDDIQIA